MMKRYICSAVVICCFIFSHCFASLSQEIKDKYNDAYFVALSAAACVETYVEKEQNGFSFLRTAGWKVAEHTFGSKKTQAHFVVAQSVTAGGNPVYVIGFRGSTELRDWGINLRTAHSVYGGNNLKEMRQVSTAKYNSKLPAVHKGFNEYVLNVLENFVLEKDGSTFKGIFKQVNDNPKARLIITGHSLGGAAATLLGERLFDLGMNKERFKVVTFGAPAVGNQVFATVQGPRINLIRYTNSEDPVPGSLQSFFNGYKQFGEQRKNHIENKRNDSQHDSALYLDCAFSDYYTVRRLAERDLGQPLLQMSKNTDGVAKVGLVFLAAKNYTKYSYVPDIKQFVMDRYMRLFPSYTVFASDYDNGYVNSDGGWSARKLMEQGHREKCDYVLFCCIDGREDRKKRGWYIDLTQSLYRTDGTMLTMACYSKRVSPSCGNILAAGEDWVRAVTELKPVIPFAKSRQYVEIFE